ncbi:MAG: hypothetical protein JNL21_32950 [Myxococcales bacterium]|nr:hypothetical protein [Myxococcales bacterium]
MAESLNYTNGVAAELDALAASTLELGQQKKLVDAYLERNELKNDDLGNGDVVERARIKAQMAQFIKDLPLGTLTEAQAKSGDFDEYFALAYADAQRRSRGEDPIDTIRNGGQASWNFEVDQFDTIEAQGILPESIRAAGALDYVWVLGEKMGVFRLVDALVLRWAAGEIDVGEPDATKPSLRQSNEIVDRMYRYFKLRDERLSADERGMVFRRVLAKGNSKLLSRMVPNEHFPRLWGTLMNEFVAYIRKLEDSYGDEGLVSTTPIYEATQQLQVNLSEHMTGMALMQTREMYFHLKEAMAILAHPAIVGSVVGGRRQSVWAVLETLAREELGTTLNVAALRNEAVYGNTVFRWVAGFDKSTVSTQAFREARAAAEGYILAQAALGPETAEDGDGEEPSEDEEEPGDDTQDFGDF